MLKLSIWEHFLVASCKMKYDVKSTLQLLSFLVDSIFWEIDELYFLGKQQKVATHLAVNSGRGMCTQPNYHDFQRKTLWNDL